MVCGHGESWGREKVGAREGGDEGPEGPQQAEGSGALPGPGGRLGWREDIMMAAVGGRLRTVVKEECHSCWDGERG